MTDRIERELALDAPPAVVWLALTDSDWLAQWLADEVSLDLRPGGEARFRFGERERRGWVEEIEPPRPAGRSGRVRARLTFWWEPDDEPASRVELSLEALDAEEAETVLRVVETRPLEAVDLVGIELPGLGLGARRFGPALVAA